MPTTVVNNASSQKMVGKSSNGSGTGSTSTLSHKSTSEAGDALSRDAAPDAKKIKVAAYPSATPKPEAPSKMQYFQIVGAESSKTLFSSADFGRLQKNLCREGQPLVLVRDKMGTGSVEKFIFGPEFMQRASRGEVPAHALQAHEANLFFVGNANHPDIIPLASLVASDPDLGLLDAPLGVNSPHQTAHDVSKRQILIAAMVEVGVLKVKNPLLATQAVIRMPDALKKAGLDAALLECPGHQNPSIAKQLLQWGADSNAVDPDDDFSVLGTSIRYLNEPIIRLLMEYGADPHRATETDCSAMDLVKSAPYQQLAPLLERTPAAP